MKMLIFLLLIGANLPSIEMPTIELSPMTFEELKNEPIRSILRKTDDDSITLDPNKFDFSVKVEYPYLFKEPRVVIDAETIVIFLSPKNDWCECLFPKVINAQILVTPKQDNDDEFSKMIFPISITIDQEKPWIIRCLWELVALVAVVLLIVILCVWLKKNHPKQKKNSFFDLDFLDYVIFTWFTWFQGKSLQLSEDNSEIIAMYDYFGRWFSKKEILDRINELREKEKPIDQLLSDQNRKKSMILALKSISSGIVGLEHDVNREIIIEVNNLSRRGKSLGVQTLLKYFTPLKISKLAQDKGNMCCQYLPLLRGVGFMGIPSHMIMFWWKQDDKVNAVCYRSITDDVNFFDVFGISPSLAFFEGESLKGGMLIDYNDVLGYSGDDYALVFRIEGNNLTCGRPPLIKHEYELPLIPHHISVNATIESFDHELIEKYYALYHLGNKKAEEALRRSGFNLKAKDE